MCSGVSAGKVTKHKDKHVNQVYRGSRLQSSLSFLCAHERPCSDHVVEVPSMRSIGKEMETMITRLYEV